MNKKSGQQPRLVLLAACMLLTLGMASSGTVLAGTIGGGDLGRCERLASESTQVCTGKGKKRVCVTEDTFCGGLGNDGSCSCDSACEANGNCCADYAPVCAGEFQCAPDSGQIAFLHVGGMCSSKWDYEDDPDRLADVSGIANATAVDVKAVQTDDTGTQVAAKTLGRYLDACCTDSNSCVVYNYSNGDNVMGYALDQLATVDRVCTGKGRKRQCEESLAWNILEVRTSAGNGGGSELSDWGALADLFACELASEIGPSQVRNLYDHNNTRGVPVFHTGGFLDQVSGSDNITLDAAWWFLPWHNDGAVGYHSSGARNTAVEWCGDGQNLSWDWDYFGYWCTDEDLCSSNYGTLFQGHNMAYCGMEMENVDHYDQKMSFIQLKGQ
ncbi:MAG: hypothetical protein HKN15_01360 [Xanthomonadales bacterium]|nr:hypothetical protein [Xanthomonadales bacterium]